MRIYCVIFQYAVIFDTVQQKTFRRTHWIPRERLSKEISGNQYLQSEKETLRVLRKDVTINFGD
jgi:hypothetical protein